MISLLDEIENYIKTQKLETNCYKGSKPAAPDCLTCLYETTGFKPDMTFDNDNVEYPGLQVMCRGTDYAETRNRINTIYKKLHGCTEVPGIMNLIAQQSPVSLGQDEQRRWEFSVNFKIIKMM